MQYKEVAGGICAPKGFAAAGVHCGIRANHAEKYDLALIKADVRCAAAGVYTTNKVCGAPIKVDRAHLKDGYAQAIIVNSGNANTCAANGVALAEECCALVGEALHIPAEDVLPASTGVIGQPMVIDPFARGIPAAAAKLSATAQGSTDAATAIMTTDTHKKEYAIQFELGGKVCTVGAIGKGSGMIAPNMATMIGVLLCDAKVGSLWWQEAVAAAADRSFNSITVDGDTSTNDCVLALANGASEVVIDSAEGRQALLAVMVEVCQALAFMLIQDAEGGTKILRIKVQGAASHAEAELAARAVGNSPLVKTAFFGQDANWGRIVAALGRSGANFSPDEVSVRIGGITVFERGMPVADDLDALLAPHMRRGEISLDVELGNGPGRYLLLASDLTYDYIKINADYRT